MKKRMLAILLCFLLLVPCNVSFAKCKHKWGNRVMSKTYSKPHSKTIKGKKVKVTGKKYLLCTKCKKAEKDLSYTYYEDNKIKIKKCSHSWSKWKDGQEKCYRTCSKCGKEQTKTHSWSKYKPSRFSTHYQECKRCGETKNHKPHEWQSIKSGPETCKAKCKVCNERKTSSGHEWISKDDEEGFWYECKYCKRKTKKEWW